MTKDEMSLNENNGPDSNKDNNWKVYYSLKAGLHWIHSILVAGLAGCWHMVLSGVYDVETAILWWLHVVIWNITDGVLAYLLWICNGG